MPRKAIDYQKVIIYKLVCNDLSIKDLYVGHTTDFTNRKKSHKDRCIHPNNPKYNLKVYQIMRENGSWDNWSMIEIEKYPCNDDNEARARERFWYEELQATMNTQCPILDVEDKKQYAKWYYKNNIDKLLEDNKDYYKKNKDVIDTKHKDYYVRNKDKFNEKNNCECGGNFTTQHKLAHFKTLKHIKYIQEKESD
jgi:hypothetical protein